MTTVIRIAARVPAISVGGCRKALATVPLNIIFARSGGWLLPRSERRLLASASLCSAAGAARRCASKGTRPMATSSEAASGSKMEILTTWANCRVDSSSRSTTASGRNTTAVVALVARIALTVRRNPLYTAFSIVRPSSSRLLMASNTTTLLSTTRPITSIKPNSDTRLSVCPAANSIDSAAQRLTGTAIPTTATARHCLRKKKRTIRAMVNPETPSFDRCLI